MPPRGEAARGADRSGDVPVLVSALRAPPVQGAAALGVPDLAGRDAERSLLVDALTGEVAVVLVEGESGIGKSRLVAEALRDPRAARLRVLTANCPAVETPFPFGAIVDALHGAVSDPSRLLERATPLAGALRPLLPEWTDALPSAPEPVEDAAAERHRVFRALAEVFAALRTDVFAVEDVHWADDSTIELLLFLAAAHSVRLVLTWRPEDLGRRPLLGRLARLAAGFEGLRLSLQPIDAAATSRLAASMLGAELPAALAAELHRRTGGVPLLAEESVRLLHSQGGRQPAPDPGANSWSGVPPSVSDLARERADRLSPDAQAVLRAAAVLSVPAAESELGAVAGLDASTAPEGLSAALASGLIAEDDRGLVAFRHALMAEAVDAQLSGPERRLLHARACEALETRSPPPFARLVRHARAAGDRERWLRYGEQAAEVALASGDDAASEAVLSELITGAEPDAADLVRLVTHLPFAALTSGDRYRGIIEALRRALDETLPEPVEADLRWQLARVLMKADEIAAACVEMELAIPHLDHNPAAAGRAMISLAQLSWADWPGETRLEWMRRGAALAAAGSALERLDLTIDRAVLLLRLGEDEGWEVAAEIPDSATDPNLQVRIARGLGNVGHLAAAWGRNDESRRLLTRAIELAELHGYGRLLSGFRVTVLHLDYITGAWMGLAERAAEIAADPSSSPGVRLEARLVTGLLDAAAGRDPQAAATLRDVLAGLRALGVRDLVAEAAASVAQLALAAGQVDDALTVVEDLAGMVAGGNGWVAAGDLLLARVRVLVAAGRRAEAEEFVASCAEAIGTPSAPAALAALATARGVLAESAGEPAAAATAFEEGAALWDRLPRPYDALLARERQARCLLAVDEQAGSALLVDLLRDLTRLGAAGPVDRVVRLLREHGVETRGPGWRGGRTGYGDRLSPREREVVRLVIAGHTNREIAEILFRSPRTVETQVRSAMRKLDVTSRTALAVRAAELEPDITPSD